MQLKIITIYVFPKFLVVHEITRHFQILQYPKIFPNIPRICSNLFSCILFVFSCSSVQALNSGIVVSPSLIAMNFLLFVIGILSLCAPTIASWIPVNYKKDGPILQSVLNSHIQENINPISHGGDEDWLSNALDGIASLVVSKLSDPKNTEEERKYLKISRLFIEPLVEYHDKAKPNDKVASKILHVLKSFLFSLEKEVNNHPGNDDVGQQVFAARSDIHTKK